MSDALYQAHILEHARHPQNKGRLVSATSVQRELNPSCGDEITIYVQCDDAGIIRAASFEGHGCAISQAAASLLTDHVQNMTQKTVLGLTLYDITLLLGIAISQTRRNCALLPLRALQNALLFLAP